MTSLIEVNSVSIVIINMVFYVTDKWSPLFVVIYIYLVLKSNTCSLILPRSLAVFSVTLSTSVSTSHQARYLKGKELGPTCGHEPRSHSKCQLSSSFSGLPGAYIVQNPNWYLNIMILLKTKSTNWQHLATKVI